MTRYLLVAIAAVGLWSPVPVVRAQAGAFDVCALMSREEVMKITNRTDLSPGRPRQLPEGAAECRYAGGPPIGSVTIVAGKSTKAKWDEFMKTLKDSGATLEAAPGVGAGAFFWDDNRLYVHSGAYEVAISTSPTAGANAARIRADEVAIAKAVLAKLKS